MSRLKLAEYRTLRQVLGILQSLMAADSPAVSPDANALRTSVEGGVTPADHPGEWRGQSLSGSRSHNNGHSLEPHQDRATPFDRGLAVGPAEVDRMHAWLKRSGR